MRTSKMKKALGQLAVIAVAWGLWTSAIAAPNWGAAAGDLRAAPLPAGHVEAIINQTKNRGVSPQTVGV